MTQLLNRPDLKLRRQSLRKNSPVPELRLWGRIRDRQLHGYKFRRQYSIGGFVVDFYCPKVKIAIEIDGESHYRTNARLYDLQRERTIKTYGIRIVRFTNKEVIQNLDEVLESINSFLNKNTSS